MPGGVVTLSACAVAGGVLLVSAVAVADVPPAAGDVACPPAAPSIAITRGIPTPQHAPGFSIAVDVVGFAKDIAVKAKVPVAHIASRRNRKLEKVVISSCIDINIAVQVSLLSPV